MLMPPPAGARKPKRRCPTQIDEISLVGPKERIRDCRPGRPPTTLYARPRHRPGRALNRPTWSPVKGSSASVSTIRSATVVRQRFFGIPATDTDIILAQHFWTGGLETAGPGCYDAVAIA
jgi:hypothetical protein